MAKHGELQQQFARYDATMSIYGLILYRLSLTTMISVGLIKEEIFVVRVAWISIGFFYISRGKSV